MFVLLLVKYFRSTIITVLHISKIYLSPMEFLLRVCHADLLHKLKSYGTSCEVLSLTPPFFSYRQLHLDRKYFNSLLLMLRFPWDTFLRPNFFFLNIIFENNASYFDNTSLTACGHSLTWLLNFHLKFLTFETLWLRHEVVC